MAADMSLDELTALAGNLLHAVGEWVVHIALTLGEWVVHIALTAGEWVVHIALTAGEWVVHVGLAIQALLGN